MHAERTPERVAWAAGLFEGEGWWGVRGKTSAEAVLGSTDRDVVERFASAVGFGSIATEQRAEGHKTLYRWHGSSAPQVKGLIELFWPWLGERRRGTAQVVLDAIKDCRGPNGAKTHCAKGHAYDEANTYITPSGWRRCRTCHRDGVNAANRAKREVKALEAAGYQRVDDLVAMVVENYPEAVKAALD